MSLSEKLRALRMKKGLSQEDAAARLHVARQTVGKWENGQAVPEVQCLVAMGEMYQVSLDRLLKDDDCLPTEESSGSGAEGLAEFLLRAKRSTYAGHGKETAPSCPGSHDYHYVEGDWSYHDRYFGAGHFAGEETVRCGDQVLWCMNYAGQVQGEPFSGDFLKAALRAGTADAPWRGPAVFRQGEWLYRCQVTGDMKWFGGREEILCGDTVVYQGVFHGGEIR